MKSTLTSQPGGARAGRLEMFASAVTKKKGLEAGLFLLRGAGIKGILEKKAPHLPGLREDLGFIEDPILAEERYRHAIAFVSGGKGKRTFWVPKPPWASTKKKGTPPPCRK